MYTVLGKSLRTTVTCILVRNEFSVFPHSNSSRSEPRQKGTRGQGRARMPRQNSSVQFIGSRFRPRHQTGNVGPPPFVRDRESLYETIRPRDARKRRENNGKRIDGIEWNTLQVRT